ncbi:hypothetical protein [Tenacibaculum crassostreae]|uniref:hypothetical protein n=1 Tax=Tenacibaculum crassostreae TaxID=502683 RepID=UPI0038B69568
MKKIKTEIAILRTFTICAITVMTVLVSSAFKSTGNQKFGTIDVERINVVESDGTVKMVITNENHFPSEGDSINNRKYHKRKKRAGMIFFNEEGMESGGFIYDGAKTKNGHEAGISLTFDQYNGDQVIQLLTTDIEKNGKRQKAGYLVFNDRGDNETKENMMQIVNELKSIADRKERRIKYKEYQEKGMFGSVKRVALGQIPGGQNGLFLFDKKGNIRAKFCVDKDNYVRLESYDKKGNIIGSWPTK